MRVSVDLASGEDETIFLVNGIGVAISPRRRRQLERFADRVDGIAAARDFRRRMDDAYAAADYPIERRRRGV